MNNISNKDVSFDKNPPIEVNQYDGSMHSFCAAYAQIFHMLHAYLRSMLSTTARILVVGAGTGAEVCTFGKSNPSWNITGVDPSADMLSLAHQKIQQMGLTNVELFQGYTNELEENQSFDAATCVLVMHFLEDDGSKLQLLKDINKKMKIGAPLLLVDAFGDSKTDEFKQTLKAWMNYPVLMGVDEKIVEEGFHTQILKRLKFVPEERIKALLSEAGFDYVTRFYTGFLYGGWAAVKVRD